MAILSASSGGNSQSFVELTGGSFGRKVIYTNFSEVTSENILEILEDSEKIHNQNKLEIDYLYRYVNGDQPILYRTKDIRPEILNNVVENHALELVRFMTAQIHGEPMQYISTVTDETVSTRVDNLNKIMNAIDKPYHDLVMGAWRSTCGTAYREVWSKKEDEVGYGEPLIGIGSPDPRNNYVVYSSNKGNEPLLSVTHSYDEEDEEILICTTKTHVFTVIDDGVTAETNHYDAILLTEYPNNASRISDVEVVITLLDAINKLQSNRLDGVEQFVQFLVKFVNADIDTALIKEMSQFGAISVKTANPKMPADVGVLSNELNQVQSQILKDDLLNEILRISGMPSIQQNTGGDTGQAVILRNGWDQAEQRAKLSEPVIQKSEREFLRKALYILKTNGQVEEALSIMDIAVKISRNQTDNLLIKTQSLRNMLLAGIHPQRAIATSKLWGDPDGIYADSKEILDQLYSVEALRWIRARQPDWIVEGEE